MNFKSTLSCAAGLLVAAVASAQSYHIDWYTIDGGGGTSTGGVYTLSGTIGQPDAGTMTGGNFSLQGGFWGVAVAIQEPGMPFLSITRSNAAVIISWPGPATGVLLDQTATLNGPSIPWSQVGAPYQTNGSVISVTIPAPVGYKFYRLRK